MTIVSVGYAGTITDTNYRRMAVDVFGSLYGVDDFSSFRVTPGVGDRALALAPGGAFGLGVYDVSDAVETLTGAPVASGSRWDLVVLRRTWGTKTTVPLLVTGTSTKALPSRNTGFDGVNDQPIALVRFAAGQTAVQEIVDLRCIPGAGGLIAFDPLARSYLDHVGVQVRIGDYLWTRALDTNGSPKWIYQDVTPDTGWVEIGKNGGWSWSFGQQRRIGAMVSIRIAAARPVGWSDGNQLAVTSPQFRPDDSGWYVTSSSTNGKTEFHFHPNGGVNASQNSGGAIGVTIHTTYPAAVPTF